MSDNPLKTLKTPIDIVKSKEDESRLLYLMLNVTVFGYPEDFRPIVKTNGDVTVMPKNLFTKVGTITKWK